MTQPRPCVCPAMVAKPIVVQIRVGFSYHINASSRAISSLLICGGLFTQDPYGIVGIYTANIASYVARCVSLPSHGPPASLPRVRWLTNTHNWLSLSITVITIQMGLHGMFTLSPHLALGCVIRFCTVGGVALRPCDAFGATLFCYLLRWEGRSVLPQYVRGVGIAMCDVRNN